MEAAEYLFKGQMIPAAGPAQTEEEGRCYKDDFFAAGKKIWGFVEHGCIYDCFFVSAYKFFYFACDNGVNYRFLGS